MTHKKLKVHDNEKTAAEPDESKLDDWMEEAPVVAKWTAAESIWLTLITAISLLSALPGAGLELAVWIQPALVGLIWGGQFIAGFWGGASDRPNLFGLGLLVIASLWLSRCLQNITDFTFFESLLFTVIVSSTGWLAAKYCCLLAQPHWSRLRDQKMSQFSIIDLLFLMTVVACLVAGAKHMAAHPLFFLGVLGTLLIGSCGCWAAVNWAWNDQGPLGIPGLIFGFSIVLGLAMVYWISPSMSWWERIEWAVSGPLCVCAAQCTTALVAFAGIRQNAFHAQQPEPCSN